MSIVSIARVRCFRSRHIFRLPSVQEFTPPFGTNIGGFCCREHSHYAGAIPPNLLRIASPRTGPLDNWRARMISYSQSGEARTPCSGGQVPEKARISMNVPRFRQAAPMVTALFLITGFLRAGTRRRQVDLDALAQIKTEAFQHSQVMENLFWMSEVYGSARHQ